MGAVNWDGVERIETEGGTVLKTHQEFCVSEQSDLENIDTSVCLQGSICYDISTAKLHMWDGSAWVEQ